MPSGARGPRLNRAQLSDEERRLRSELAQLVSSYPWIRGTLAVREKTCGRASCRCARGERHEATYLVASDEGKLKQIFIPKKFQEPTRDWVENYHRIKELMEKISLLQREKIRRREL